MSRPISPAEQAVLPEDFTTLYIWTGVVVLVFIALAVLCLVLGHRGRGR